MIQKNVLYKEVISLPVAERLKLLDFVQDSLDKSDPAIDRAWVKEAKRRHTLYKAGKIRAQSIKSVFGIDV